jgi:outer membrane protein assembly factor BamD
MEGMESMQKRDYKNAIKSFQQLKERYPYSEYAILAELKLGDAHFYNKNYAEAVVAYEEFTRLHPRNEAIPYVLYQIGMCHFLEFNTIDRDQEDTRLAMDAFRRLIQAYPEAEYARRAEKQLYECQKRLVAHEFQVGKFYFRNGEYASAQARLDTIYQLYPEALADLGYKEEVRELLAASAQEVTKGERKPSIWSRMGF